MSFFPSLMGDFDDDPFMGHMRQMNRMMSSFFGGGSPFGAMMGGGGGPAAMIGGPGGGELMPFGGGMRGGATPGGALMPFGFPDMSQLFQNGAGAGNCHSFASSTITTMSNGPDGQPQVYQASQSVRSGPGGVKETKKSVADSRSGIKKMAIGHHIGDRAHIIEREHNVRSGEHIENQEYINLEEEEAPEFNQEWQQKSRSPYSAANAISYHGGPAGAGGRYSAGAQRSGYTSDNLAIMPPPPPSSSTSSSARSRARMNRKTHSSAIPSSSRAYRPAPKYDVSANYHPALPSTPRGRHAEREAEQHHDEEEEEEEDEEDDEEECGVKIVEVDDDDYEDNVNRKNGEDAATEEDNNAEPVIYVTEDTGSSRGVPGGEKGAHRSRGKKRSHEPEPEVAHKSQKFQNRP